MSAPKDGGPAFPWSPDGPNYQQFSGMSLRDWFAGQALSVLSHLETDSDYAGLRTPQEKAERLARSCYNVADAMVFQGANHVLNLSRYQTACGAVGHIRSILETKDREGVDIEIGSTALKSLIRWAQEADAALR